MRQICYAPNYPVPIPNTTTVFLAGSIEMGTATDWQDTIPEKIVEDWGSLVFLNPRRPDWDWTWEQSMENPKFHQQVVWELTGIETADVIFFYFDPATKSPISLMELGYALGMKDKTVIVCCPDGFWRQGNVDMICARNHARVFRKIDDAIGAINSFIRNNRWRGA